MLKPYIGPTIAGIRPCAWNTGCKQEVWPLIELLEGPFGLTREEYANWNAAAR
jgi:hypothetical protein